MDQPRTYRNWIRDGDLTSFHVAVKETDLYLRAKTNLREEALRAIVEYHTALEKYAVLMAEEERNECHRKITFAAEEVYQWARTIRGNGIQPYGVPYKPDSSIPILEAMAL